MLVLHADKREHDQKISSFTQNIPKYNVLSCFSSLVKNLAIHIYFLSILHKKVCYHNRNVSTFQPAEPEVRIAEIFFLHITERFSV